MFHRMGKDGSPVYGKAGAGILFTDGNSVLLLKRSNKGDENGNWGIPGGKMEDGETFLGTAQRETREEIGHLPSCRRLSDLTSNNGRHIFKIFIVSVPKRFPCSLSDEHDDYNWVDFDDLKNYSLHHKFADSIGDILNKINFHFNKNESFGMSGFAEMVGTFDVVAPYKKPKKDTYQIEGDPKSMIKPKKKKIK